MLSLYLDCLGVNDAFRAGGDTAITYPDFAVIVALMIQFLVSTCELSQFNEVQPASTGNIAR